MGKVNNLKNNFKNPTPEYRSAPFWSWNSTLSPEELSQQVRDMKAHGMGGFFIHPRDGLETSYLGDDFINCVKETVKTAKEEGIYAWLYDEDRYPSGMASSMVPKIGGDVVRAKALTIEIVEEGYVYEENVVAVFDAIIEGDNIIECVRLDPQKAEYKEKLIVIRKEVSAPREWCQNDAYVDNLNPETVKIFIETTYEKYKDAVGDEFGKTIPGIFTDEPHILGFEPKAANVAWIIWTDSFNSYFYDKRGYDFLDYVPYIFFKGDKSPKIRFDYWRTATEKFCEAYPKQIYGWCENNNIKFTGHLHSEPNLVGSAHRSGASMPQYRYYHIPGVDMLREQTNETLTLKQCTSVARQYGRKRVITETYGVTGWDFTFEGMRWIADWQLVHGINIITQHLALYTLKGCCKRDYPPSFNYNTCWWKYNNLIEDYYARITSVLVQGEAVRDVLVIHPCSTGWTMLGCDVKGKYANRAGNIKEVENYSQNFVDFADLLLSEHYDFDLGDEIIMEETGRVEDGKLFVNLASYPIVVLPTVKTLFKSTVKLLEEFLNAGGKVIAVKPLPDMIEGVKSDELTRVFSHANVISVESMDKVCPVLESIIPRRVSIKNKHMKEAPKFLYMLKDLPDCQTLFVVNNDRTNQHVVDITIEGKGRVEEWDALTGKVSGVSVSVEDDRMNFVAKFGVADSKLYVIYKNEEPVVLKPKYDDTLFNYKYATNSGSIYTALGPVCKFTRTMPNALVLDKCSYRISGGEWSDEQEVWQAQRKVREALGMKQIYYNGILQRHYWVDIPHPKDETPVEFRFEFDVTDVPQNEVYLAVEGAKYFSILLNGINVSNMPCGWYMDRAIDKVSLQGLRQGKNELILSCGYLSKMEVEDCFIIGDFGVDINRKIVSEPQILRFGDWCLQGYLHYCGSIVYHFDLDYATTVGRMVLELGEYSAVTVEIRVNGTTAGHIPWRSANGMDITDWLKDGCNKIDIEVMGSPRNLFGPLHEVGTKYDWLGWQSFRREGLECAVDYITRPYGLMGQVNIIKWTEGWFL